MNTTENSPRASSQTIHRETRGNTSNPSSHTQCVRWMFTLPIEECNEVQLSQIIRDLGIKEFHFQHEKGLEGYEHWQGCFSLLHKEYFNTVKNMFGFNKAHLEPAKDWIKCIKYCTKTDTRVKGPYDINTVFLDTPELTKEWQLTLRNELLYPPDYRKIIWIYDKNGGAGKTDFCLHMYDKYNSVIFNNGRFSDIAFALPRDPKIVIFDLPRTLEERVNYTAIEAIKNGFIFSGKYESGFKRFNKPHVVVMANFEPDYDSLSTDRWDVRTIRTT